MTTNQHQTPPSPSLSNADLASLRNELDALNRRLVDVEALLYGNTRNRQKGISEMLETIDKKVTGIEAERDAIKERFRGFTYGLGFLGITSISSLAALIKLLLEN